MSANGIVYSNSEVRLLLSTVNRATEQRSELMSLSFFLKLITNRYRSLSEGYLKALECAHENRYKGDFSGIHKILFHENINRIPLLINDPIVGFIARFRLKIGK